MAGVLRLISMGRDVVTLGQWQEGASAPVPLEGHRDVHGVIPGCARVRCEGLVLREMRNMLTVEREHDSWHVEIEPGGIGGPCRSHAGEGGGGDRRHC